MGELNRDEALERDVERLRKALADLDMKEVSPGKVRVTLEEQAKRLAGSVVYWDVPPYALITPCTEVVTEWIVEWQNERREDDLLLSTVLLDYRDDYFVQTFIGAWRNRLTRNTDMLPDAGDVSEKHKGDIYDDRGKLIQSAAATAVLKEQEIMCVDMGSRRQYFAWDRKKGYWRKVTATTVQRIAVQVIGKNATDSQAKSVTNLVGTVTEVPKEILNGQGQKINLANHTINLLHYQPEPQVPEHYFTYALPYPYDPNAECPLIDSLIEQYAMGDERWIKCFWETAGYCLQADYDINAMFWWVGGGANGKSTCQRLFKELVGEENTKTGFQVKDLNKDFFLTSVKGRRLALCGDAAVRMENIDLLKQYTGGDQLSTNVKFGDYEQFVNSAKLILCMNRAPLVNSHEALKPIKRRVVWLPFDYKITKPDPSIERRMLRELPGAFNRAMEGLRRLREQKGFTEVPRGKQALETWAGEANLLATYFETQIVRDPNGQLWMYELWDHYQEWMNEWGGAGWQYDKWNVTNQHTLSKEISERFDVEREREYTRYYDQKANKWRRGTYVKLKGVRTLSDRDDMYVPEAANLPQIDKTGAFDGDMPTF